MHLDGFVTYSLHETGDKKMRRVVQGREEEEKKMSRRHNDIDAAVQFFLCVWKHMKSRETTMKKLVAKRQTKNKPTHPFALWFLFLSFSPLLPQHNKRNKTAFTKKS